MIENILLAISELKANKMRTFLTMLGIVIGISSVIAIMTVGNSMSSAVNQSMNDMGAGNISVYLLSKDIMSDDGEEYFYREMRDKDYFTSEHFEAIRERYGDRVKGISLTASVGNVEMKNGRKTADINITGKNSPAIASDKLKIIAGRTITDEDQREKRKVILVSDKYVKDLYGESKINDIVGETLETLIDNRYFSYTVVGVYEYNASAMDFSMGRGSITTTAYIPVGTVFTQSNQPVRYDYFDVICKEGEDTDEIAEGITTLLNERFYKDNDAYEAYAYSMKVYVEETQNLMRTLELAISAIAGISLLVGGIGVMNIMIVSITERTREIGTRKALGATNSDIRTQFILEAVVICVIGGIIGVIIGLIIGIGATKLLEFPAVPSASSIIISVLFSMAFGVFFGYYPASKAAKMNPIDALRYE